MQNLSVITQKVDSRCRYWAAWGTREWALQANPADYVDTKSLPHAYLRAGVDLELPEGAFLIEAEEYSHRKKRGWQYWVYEIVRVDGSLVKIDCERGITQIKARIKADSRLSAQEIAELCSGSGPGSNVVRCARYAAILRTRIEESPADNAIPNPEATAGNSAA